MHEPTPHKSVPPSAVNELFRVNDRLTHIEKQIDQNAPLIERFDRQANRIEALDPGLVFFAELVSVWKLLGLFPGRQAGGIFLIVTAITTAESWIIRLLLK